MATLLRRWKLNESGGPFADSGTNDNAYALAESVSVVAGEASILPGTADTCVRGGNSSDWQASIQNTANADDLIDDGGSGYTHPVTIGIGWQPNDRATYVHEWKLESSGNNIKVKTSTGSAGELQVEIEGGSTAFLSMSSKSFTNGTSYYYLLELTDDGGGGTNVQLWLADDGDSAFSSQASGNVGSIPDWDGGTLFRISMQTGGTNHQFVQDVRIWTDALLTTGEKADLFTEIFEGAGSGETVTLGFASGGAAYSFSASEAANEITLGYASGGSAFPFSVSETPVAATLGFAGAGSAFSFDVVEGTPSDTATLGFASAGAAFPFDVTPGAVSTTLGFASSGAAYSFAVVEGSAGADTVTLGFASGGSAFPFATSEASVSTTLGFASGGAAYSFSVSQAQATATLGFASSGAAYPFSVVPGSLSATLGFASGGTAYPFSISEAQSTATLGFASSGAAFPFYIPVASTEADAVLSLTMAHSAVISMAFDHAASLTLTNDHIAELS